MQVGPAQKPVIGCPDQGIPVDAACSAKPAACASADPHHDLAARVGDQPGKGGGMVGQCEGAVDPGAVVRGHSRRSGPALRQGRDSW